ncbi:hypothetical protein [Rhizobium leguminosarum]|uniref:hypothetical protein n=1 Tax=Rhizobium leguminosarum TaxID=384 RepID=UPI002E153D9F|nr:hypothetical protein U8Q02_38900 [Rhizobium leguminosarum]
MSAIKRFEEMDRVEFKAAGGRMVYGTVTEASGDAVRLVTDGGRYRLRVPARRLSFSSRAVRRDLPSAMDVWQVADFADDAGADSTKYSAIITLHGVPVAGASNDGYGAPDRYLPFDGGYAVVEELAAAVDDWLAANGGDPADFVEPVNFWLLWRARRAPYGVLAAEAVEEYLASTAPRPEVEPTQEPDVEGPTLSM